MTEYTDAMAELNQAIYATVRAANNAVRAADNEDGAPVEAIRIIAAALREHAADVDSLIDTGMTRKDFGDAKSLYAGAKLAGLV